MIFFSVAILMIHCAYPQQLRKQPGKPLAQLKKMIESSEQLKPFKKSMIGALHGHYIQAGDMKQDLLRTQYQTEPSSTLDRHSNTRMSRAKKQKKKAWVYRVISTHDFCWSINYTILSVTDVVGRA